MSSESTQTSSSSSATTSTASLEAKQTSSAPLETTHTFTPLFNAVRMSAQNVGAVKSLLEGKADPNEKSGPHQAPVLLLAIQKNFLEIARLLLAHGADPTLKDKNGNTPLRSAAYFGHVDMVKLLLTTKAAEEIDEVDPVGHFTSLHTAVQKGHLSIIQLLLAARANANTVNTQGATPLASAFVRGNFKVAQALLEVKASIKVESFHQDILPFVAAKAATQEELELVKVIIDARVGVDAPGTTGKTALYWALHNNNVGLARLLIENNASIDQPLYEGTTPLWHAAAKGQTEMLAMLLEKIALLPEKDRNAKINGTGFTENFLAPIHGAVSNGHLSAMRLLIDAKADINKQCAKGKTPLSMAFGYGRNEAVKFLLEKRAEIRPSIDGCLIAAATQGNLELMQILIREKAGVNALYKGATPLRMAAEHGHVQAIELLVTERASIHARDINNDTFLHVAVEYGQVGVVSYLLSQKAEIDSLGHKGSTALCSAAEHGHTALVKMLLEHRATVDIANEDGRPPLHEAIAAGKPEVVKILLDAKAVISAGEGHRTALHVAASYGMTDIAEDLIARKAQVNAGDERGVTPLQIAMKGGHLAVVDLFLDKGGKLVSNYPAVKWEGSPLEAAVIEGQVSVIEFLIKRKRREIFQKSWKDENLLHVAAGKGRAEFVPVLMKARVEIRAKDSSGSTPLHMAVRSGNLDTVRHVIEAKGSPFDINRKGEKPIECLGSDTGNPIYRLLAGVMKSYADGNELAYEARIPVEEGAEAGLQDAKSETEINKRNEKGLTPVQRAARQGKADLVIKMVQARADINRPRLVLDSSGLPKICGNTALYDAAKKGYTDVVRVLLAAKAHLHTEFSKEDPLHVACREGRMDIVACLLDAKADANARSEEGHTALEWIAEKGHDRILPLLIPRLTDVYESRAELEKALQKPLIAAVKAGSHRIVSALLEAKASLDVVPEQSTSSDWHERPTSLVNMAASQGHADVLEVLIGAKALLNNSFYGNPLHEAINGGHYRAVALLLDNGADVNGLGTFNYTPLHTAVEARKPEIAQLLITKKADINKQNMEGNTPLHLVKGDSKPTLVRLLLDARANPFIENRQKCRAIRWIGRAQKEAHDLLEQELYKVTQHSKKPEAGSAISSEDNLLNELHSAARDGNLDLVKKALGAKADINKPHLKLDAFGYPDGCGHTALYFASAGGHIAVVRHLLEAGASLQHLEHTSEDPLHAASRNGDIDMMKCLVEAKADLEVEDANGCTPLHLATEKGHLPTVSVLLGLRADLHKGNPRAYSNDALCYAATAGHDDVVKALRTAGANIPHPSLLSRVVKEGHEQVVRTLLEFKVSPNKRNTNSIRGDTPLQMAVLDDSRAIASCLLDAGAKVNMRNAVGQTPLHFAVEWGTVEMLDLLLKAKADPFIKNLIQKTPRAMTVNLAMQQRLVKAENEWRQSTLSALIPELGASSEIVSTTRIWSTLFNHYRTPVPTEVPQAPAQPDTSFTSFGIEDEECDLFRSEDMASFGSGGWTQQ